MHVWSGVRSFSPRPHEGRVFRRERQRERFDKRLTGMHDVITDFLLADKSRAAFWEEWRYQVSHARQQVERRKVTFYCLRFFATVSTILVASLVGLNLSGAGGIAVRWMTFVLGLMAAVSTAFITLYRLEDRWMMYQRLTNDLMKTGWDFVNCPDQDREKGWKDFVSCVTQAISQHNQTYAALIIGAAQSRGKGECPTPDVDNLL